MSLAPLGERAGMGQRGCRECKRPVPPGAIFCSTSCKSAYQVQSNPAKMLANMKKARGRAAEERSKNAPRVNPFERARRKKSEQTEKTEAFYSSVREWYWKQVRAYEDHVSSLGVPALVESGSTACGLFQMHRCGGGMEVDHVGTRSDKSPANLQTLCHVANMAKGSQKGSKYDYRSDEWKAWLLKARDRDFVWNNLHQKWEARDNG